MPDFEALVKHQQNSRRPSTERLKIVEKTHVSSQTPITDGNNFSALFFSFIGGLAGSIIGAGLIFYLSANELIDFKVLF